MALWNVKFDHVNGENRVCKHCGVTFHTIKPRYSCSPCLNARQKVIEQKKRSRYEKKEPYPYQGPNHDYHQRFYPLRAKLHKMKVREEWQKYFTERLDEIFNDAVLMKWINDRRDKETADARQVKSKKSITKEYPNHHDYYEY
jgi:protein-arginine kinase activator protein McsA